MSDRLDTALGNVLEAQAHNDRQRTLIYNPSDDEDSLLERVCALRDYGVPARLIDELVADAIAVYRSNCAERDQQRAAAGNLDIVLRGAPRAITVKGFARAARVLLSATDDPGAKGLMAQRSLRLLCDENADVLKFPSLRHELGAGSYARLQMFTTQETHP